MPSRNRWWKLLGLSTVLGVAASGAVAARSVRPQVAYSPNAVTERLRARYREAKAVADEASAGVDGSE